MADHPLASLPRSGYEKGALDFIKEALREGEAILQEEAGYKDIPEYLHYMTHGDRRDTRRPDFVAYYPINRATKAVAENAAAMTDVKPMFGFKSSNPLYEAQSLILNKRVRVWWLNNDIDIRNADVVTWAQVAGSGYALIQQGDEDTVMEAIDPRDVVPVRPDARNSVQSCLGVIIRSSVSLNRARQMWPDKHIVASREGSFLSARMRRLWRSLSPGSGASTQDMNIPTVDIYTLQIKDRSINPTDHDITLGPSDESGRPLTNYSYIVRPGEPLYPRGRWIIATPTTILSDGPNPYWHGMFTVEKLTLDPVPWSWFGRSQLRDLIPLNDLLNELVSKVVQAARKNLRPGIIADRGAMPESVLANLDTMRDNVKLMVNPSLGDAIKFTEPVNVPAFVMDIIQFVVAQIDDLAGTRGLQELLTLKQMPGADTLEKLESALTPLVKARGRRLEAYLRNVAEMVKYNFFQFDTTARRFQLLGPDGLTFEDFDFDPGNLVPNPDPSDTRPTVERAIDHIKNFAFYSVPNSLLDIAQVERKLLYLTLRRMGEIDHRTLLQVLDIQDIDGIDERLGSEIDQKIAMAAGLDPRAGRPPTAQKMPKLESRGGRPPIVSESG